VTAEGWAWLDTPSALSELRAASVVISKAGLCNQVAPCSTTLELFLWSPGPMALRQDKIRKKLG